MPPQSSPAISILSYLRRTVNQCYQDRTALKKMYLQELDTCVPEEFIGDDVLLAIKDKFYYPFDAVREELQIEFGCDLRMWIHVDPTYEDTTCVLLTLNDSHVLHHYATKAWNFCWPDEAELEKDLLEWDAAARERYRQAKGDLVDKPENRLYMADFELVSGEYGQPFHHIFEARDEKDLHPQIEEYLKNYYTGGSRRKGYKWFYHNDEVVVELHGWEKITRPRQVLKRLKM